MNVSLVVNIVLCCWELELSCEIPPNDGVVRGRCEKASPKPVWVQNVSGCGDFNDKASVHWLIGVCKCGKAQRA